MVAEKNFEVELIEEEIKLGIINIAGHNQLLAAWCNHLVLMYRDSMNRNNPALVQKLAAVSSFSKGLDSVIGRYYNNDGETIDLFVKHLGDFFRVLRKADPKTRSEFFSAFDDILDQLEARVNGSAG